MNRGDCAGNRGDSLGDGPEFQDLAPIFSLQGLSSFQQDYKGSLHGLPLRLYHTSNSACLLGVFFLRFFSFAYRL